ncbi:transmembrane protein [Apis mellifera caucasica]|uniref:Transmembrane protein 256 homolog n=1 Tax=Apis mellifera TaxID=7460 RepID=A0A7M7L5R9_APIME|nr:transmembrane protein 256 homolog [Apis mellifera]KAG6800948.1 transmembrane protein [Apis mellifera caucasica]KAG9433773.1 transmembrane protein [Apis mellifera carnica]|eukprot:XP_026296774.1 transmembrane protein 256 homolog [Apis mellifera]
MQNIMVFINPLHYTSLLGDSASYVWRTFEAAPKYLGLKSKNEIKIPSPIPLWKLAADTGPYVRLAAFSGAAAVILNGYGFYKQYPKYDEVHLKKVFETASYFHFIHTLAMLGLPLCKRPLLSTTFLVSGIILCCGTCYYYAFTGKKQHDIITKIGGMCFIIGWLCMCI